MKINLPNSITLFRVLSAPVFAGVLYYRFTKPDLHWWVFGVFCLAAVSDALDGTLARLRHEKTYFGTVLDPIADKLLLLTGFIILSAKGMIPVWLSIIIVSRDMMIVGGVLIIDVMTQTIYVKSRMLGKGTTAIQMVTLSVILFLWEAPVVLLYLTALMTIISGIDYGLIGSRYLSHTTKDR